MLVSARKFPGIDETKLDAVTAPAALESAPRRWTAPELLEIEDEGTPASDDATADGIAYADLGEVRTRAGLAQDD